MSNTMQMEGNVVLGDGLGPNSCLHLEVSLQESKIMYHKNQGNSLTCLKRGTRGQIAKII